MPDRLKACPTKARRGVLEVNAREWDETIRALQNVADIEEMVAAAQRMHKDATQEDLPRLMELLKNEDSFVREAAAWPVSELAGPAALQELLVAHQLGLDQGHDNDGFTAALIDLVESNRTMCGEVLKHLAAFGGEAMRANALWLLEFCEVAGDA